jgi:hypothetical protein
VVRWALEDLPSDVKVRTVVFLAPSIWTEVDMGPALQAVEHRLYYTKSDVDVLMLGVGTSIVGTPDRDFGPSAGNAGFAKGHAKLVVIPLGLKYAARTGHLGDHAGGFFPRFTREVTARCLAEEDFDPARL